MGFALSWITVRGKPAATVLAELSLRATGRRSFEGEAPYLGAESADGWYVVVAKGAENALLAPDVLESLSRGCEVLTCTVEEHVMFSEATGWRDGRRLWHVAHHGVDGPVGLEATGELPAEYPSIRDALQAQQAAEGGADADVDFLFEIPVSVVRALTGYRHDEPSPAFEAAGLDGLEVLATIASATTNSSWLGRLLRR
jgi:hypothetical protein